MPARYAEATFMPDGDMPSEFSAVDVDIITEALTFTAPLVSVVEWLEEASIAHALLAAHWLKRNGHGSNRRTIEPTYSRMVGPVSHGPNPATFAASDLDVTEYGRHYKRLLMSRAPAFGVLVI